MPDIEGIIKITNLLLQRIIGKNVPVWISPLIYWILLGVLLLYGLWELLVLLSKIKEVWVQSFLPLFYKPEQKRRQRRRRMFAKHLEYEISRLDLLEDWKDEHFAELEAEVEAVGRRKRFALFPFNQPKDGLRREKSLSKALANSQERFILVEGEPGSGKSVALRHVAQHMAERAKKSRSMKSVIPIYVNLKELERPDDEVIDRNLIESFILKSLKRINDRDVDIFLDDEFREGITNGAWFFLFDSFDELPEVLSSAEADVVIKSYSDAIADFLQGGMSQCRGVIASRQFRGPKHFRWPRFCILALSELRRRELVRKADLPLTLERDLIGYLGTANQEIRSMTGNPLFLSLLCEHMKSGHPFPENTHAVFETYIEHRLNRDKERILQRFQIDVQQIRTAAENIAFCMVSNTGLGLGPKRANLHSTVTRQDLDVGANFDTLLDALEYIKLARSEAATEIGESRSFTFAHRRFQEYFATCVVLHDPTHVSPKQLLTDGRWRETAVVMCQTQPVQALAPLIRYAELLLTRFCQNIPNLIDNPLAYLDSKDRDVSMQQVQDLRHFPWPTETLHLLALLQEGFTSRLDDLPNAIKMYVGKLGLSATEIGELDVRKWVLEVAGVAPEPILRYMLKKAFVEKSQWLKEVAYRQVARIHDVPDEIAQGIYEAIINLYLDGRLRRERYATRTHLMRLPKKISKKTILYMELLLHLYFVNICYQILLLFIIYLSQFADFVHFISLIFLIIAIMLFDSYLFRYNTKWLPSRIRLCMYSALIYVCLLSSTNKNVSYLPILMLFISNSLIIPYIYDLPFAYKNAIKWKLCIFIPLPIILSVIFLSHKFFVKIIEISLFMFNTYKSVVKMLKTFNLYKVLILLFCAISLLSITLIISNLTVIIYHIKIFVYQSTLLRNIVSFIINRWDQVYHSIAIVLLFFIIAIKIAVEIFGRSKEYGEKIIEIAKNIVYSTKSMIYLAHSWLRWWAWIRSSQRSINHHEFYVMIENFHHANSSKNIIRHVRKSHLLIATTEVEASLKKLALEVEIYLRSKLQRASECPILVEEADYETLDELYLLLEDIRVSLYGNAISI